MAKQTVKKTTTTKKKSANPVGRPKKKMGSETLMDHKKSFKVNNENVVFGKMADPLILGAIIFLMACIFLAWYYFTK